MQKGFRVKLLVDREDRTSSLINKFVFASNKGEAIQSVKEEVSTIWDNVLESHLVEVTEYKIVQENLYMMHI